MRQNIKITTIVITINTTITDSTTSIIMVHGIISSLEDTVMGKNYKQHRTAKVDRHTKRSWPWTIGFVHREGAIKSIWFE